MRLASIGNYIRNTREQIGLTQAELASLLGVNKVQVSQWELEVVNIPLRHVQNICYHLKMDTKHLLHLLEEQRVVSARRKFWIERNKQGVVHEDVK